MSFFRILALDGGGIRSVFQARIIERIEAEIRQNLSPDMWGGTSGGSVVATACQVMSSQMVVELFKREARKIFKKDGLLDDVQDFWNLTGASYSPKELKRVLRENFGTMTLGDLPAKTLINSFSLHNATGSWHPAVFHNLANGKYPKSLTVASAILRSVSAPTYFPVVSEEGEKFCDGGVWGNNPSMSCLAAACDPFVGGIDTKRVVILSLGTGRKMQMLKGKKLDLGAADWFRGGIIDVLLDGNIEAAHYYSRSLLQERYFRVQVDLSSEIALDEADSVPRMIALADGISLEPILQWLQGFWFGPKTSPAKKKVLVESV